MPQAISPIPVNIITGTLGAGKTTAIARLLADKAAHESWLIILNEFTDTGIDTLTLAAAARGAYDVRTIPGGCLCCTGEEDFRRQLSGILDRSPEEWPARIVIEPSGIGYPGAVVEELRAFERSGALKLHSTIVLLDAHGIDWSMLDEVAQAQVDAADVVLLSKAELVDADQRSKFMRWAQGLFPSKRYVGYSEQGRLPELALAPPPAAFSFQLMTRPPLHQQALLQTSSAHAHEHEPAQLAIRALTLANTHAQATTQRLLGRAACGWRIPSTVMFALPALATVLNQQQHWNDVERFKAIVRTGVESWHLVQRWRQQVAITPSHWSQDSRIELQLLEGVPADDALWSRWDERWRELSEPCPIG